MGDTESFDAKYFLASTRYQVEQSGTSHAAQSKNYRVIGFHGDPVYGNNTLDAPAHSEDSASGKDVRRPTFVQAEAKYLDTPDDECHEGQRRHGRKPRDCGVIKKSDGRRLLHSETEVVEDRPIMSRPLISVNGGIELCPKDIAVTISKKTRPNSLEFMSIVVNSLRSNPR